MRNKIKKLFLLITVSIIILTVGITNTAFASFADYDDETAEKETQNLLAEQEKEEQNIIGKSTNNYLSKLNVEEYQLTPEFQKQTLEYSIETKLNKDSIKIEAEAEDSRAKVRGIGNVKLQNGENNIRIDVEAESGTVRTYFIKVVTSAENKLGENVENTDNSILNNSNTSTVDAVLHDETRTDTFDTNNRGASKIKIIILIAIILLAIILFRAKKRVSKKRKHSK